MIRNSQAGITRRAWRQSSTARALPEIDAQVEVSCLESDDTFLGSVVNGQCLQRRQMSAATSNVINCVKSDTASPAASALILLMSVPEQELSPP